MIPPGPLPSSRSRSTNDEDDIDSPLNNNNNLRPRRVHHRRGNNNNNNNNSNDNNNDNTTNGHPIYGDPSHKHNLGAIASVDPDDAGAKKRSPSKDDADSDGYALPIPVAVLLWYLLGVMSITSSKILLSSSSSSSSSSSRPSASPLVLTVQQLAIGATLLWAVLGARERRRRGRTAATPTTIVDRDRCEAGGSSPGRKLTSSSSSSSSSSSDGRNAAEGRCFLPSSAGERQLFLTALYFAMGFLFTNRGFESGSVAFVETIKAAEPFTSASVAVIWGIERLGWKEVMSLFGIVAGVALSTMGHRGDGGAGSVVDSAARRQLSSSRSSSSSSFSLPTVCLVVMASNLCFSFRGLHQKLFRSTPRGNSAHVDDLTLQFRMQQIGALMLGVPALLSFALGGGFGGPPWNVESVGVKPHHHRHLVAAASSSTSSSSSAAMEYVLLSLANGVAFAAYNLASTYVLTRISVVHHAALNCIRRVFAIIVTSIIFGSTVTSLQVAGMSIAVAGFFSYMHFKSRNERRVELRRKWGGVLRMATTDRKNMRNGARWRTGYGRSNSFSSFLPTNNPVR